MDNSFKYFQNLILQLQNESSLVQSFQKAILLYGMTGAGKSTLLHYLLKDPKLVASKNKKRIIFKCEGENQFSHIKIGERMESETKSPITISHQGLVFRDLPGFADNRKDDESVINQGIINQLYFKTLLKNTKKYKILLVVKESYFENKCLHFISSLEHFKMQFQNKLSQIKQNCLLIVSQATKDCQQDFIKDLQSYLKQIQRDQDNKQFLNYLLQHNRIEYFYSPESSGKICYKNSQSIKEKIDSIKYLSNQRDSHQLKLSANSKQQLLKSRPRIKSQLSKVISIFDKLVESQIKAAYTKNGSLEKSKLEQQMIKLHNILKGMNINEGQSNIFQKLQYAFERYEQIKTFLLKIKHILNFLSILGQQVEKQLYQFKDIFQTIQNSIKTTIYQTDYQTDKIVMVNQSQVGYLTQKSQINSLQIQNIIVNNSDMFNTFIFVSNKINLSNGIKAPSKNLVLITKIIQTPLEVKTKIDLKGDDGKSILPETVLNQDGKPGNNGKHGGSCLIRADQIKGMGIIIDLRGGKGGDGQNCQIDDIEQKIVDFQNTIKNDHKNDEKNKIFLKSRDNHYFDNFQTSQIVIRAIKAVVTFNQQVLETYSTATTKAWNNYYKLKPGQGGKPGKQGKLYYRLKKNAPNQNKICFFNSDEDAGKNGSLKLDIWEGKYVRELAFARVRKEGKQFSDEQLRQTFMKEIQLGTVTIDDQILMEQVSQETVQIAMKEAIEKMEQTYTAQQVVKYVASQVTTSKTIFPSMYGLNAVLQGPCSVISASLSDNWKEEITYKGKGYFNPPIFIKSKNLVAKSKFSLDKQYFLKNYKL